MIKILFSLLTTYTPIKDLPKLDVYPLVGIQVSSAFGHRIHPISEKKHFHKGVDLKAKTGTSILAIGEGTVVFAGEFKEYGVLIVISHGSHLTSHYGHCDEISVHVGEAVRAGTVIGKVGSTGYSTGSHLHFEIRRRGTPLNPAAIFSGLAEKAIG